MKKIEQKFTTKLGKSLKVTLNNLGHSLAYEIKQTKTDYLNYRLVKDHQIAGLLTLRDKGLWYKFPDVGYTRFPIDAMFLQVKESYVIIRYNSLLRGNKEYVQVPIDEFVYHKNLGKDKSLKEKKAIEIGELCIL